jgi:hypothetical protein
MNTVKNLKVVWLILLALLTGNVLAQRQPSIQYWRPYDQRGVGVFETTKDDTVGFDGLKVRFGAGFSQGYQSFSHSNTTRAILPGAAGGTVSAIETAPKSGSFININTGAEVPNLAVDPRVYGGYINTVNNATYTNSNQVYQMAAGFPLAQANLNIDVQLADGVSLNLVSYMSSHHHNEFWVKGGYFQIDKVGFMNSEFMNKLWKNLTLKIGHMEVNYGDAHFRRSDGGNTLYNPFMENNIMDEFSTEIGGELYFKKAGFIGMLGLTDGEIQGNVSKPDDRKPSIYGKVGFDKNLSDDLRVRLTGSFYTTKSSISNTIFGGDRTGSNYQYVMENTAATLTGNAFSGRFNPGFRDNITAFMINPFVKFRGLELFGTYEKANGNTAVENGEIQYSNPTLPRFSALDDRDATQKAIDVIYRFGKHENFYIGGRYNQVDATIAMGQATTATGTTPSIKQGTRLDVGVERTSLAAGWFITRNVLFKAEYVTQNYDGYPEDNILSDGKFDGFIVQGVIGF